MDMMVSLDEELAGFVEGQVGAGRFLSSSEVVREALQLMRAIEQPDADRLRWLRSAWKDGVESGDAGEIDFAALKADARVRRAAPVE